MEFTEHWGAVGPLAGTINIEPFPGSRKMCVIHGTFIEQEYRGIGIGQRLQRRALEWAKRAGFTVVVCTTKQNPVQDERLPKLGWTIMHDGGLWKMWRKKL